MSAPRIGVVTVSDRASQGVYEDQSGPAIEAALRDYLATDCEFDKRVIADERELIGATIRELAEAGCCLICTTGGTGACRAQACCQEARGCQEARRAQARRRQEARRRQSLLRPSGSG